MLITKMLSKAAFAAMTSSRGFMMQQPAALTLSEASSACPEPGQLLHAGRGSTLPEGFAVELGEPAFHELGRPAGAGKKRLSGDKHGKPSTRPPGRAAGGKDKADTASLPSAVPSQARWVTAWAAQGLFATTGWLAPATSESSLWDFMAVAS